MLDCVWPCSVMFWVYVAQFEMEAVVGEVGGGGGLVRWGQ